MSGRRRAGRRTAVAAAIRHHGHIEHVPAIVTREGSTEDFDRYFDEGFAALGPESRHLRFFTAVRELPPDVRERLRNVDGYTHAAVIAFDAAAMLPDHPEGRPIGVARWIGAEHGPPELSITVIDEYQGMGVGVRLMDALLALARKRGVRRMMADVLRENIGMRHLVNRYNHVVQPSGDPVVVRYRIDV
ncbi:MAG TPA: GNAT family N-acetyltransferase [Ilumatobacteraceae bacterium]|nr:GNAT family N-acetyltransferase [Ilumatobacteraceae bacterium]HUC33925.1 GNAT family N-acetyltransferase [Ilumatobacteraceae bacterium]